MFQFINYNFFSDIDCLNTGPSQVDNITSTRIENAIYDHFNVTRNTTLEFSTEKPTEWDFDTVMDAPFDGNISAGNVDFTAEQITAIRIKRRKKGTFNWLVLGTIPISEIEDLNFVFTDRLNAYGVEYDYAFVPILEGAEGDYIINTILSKFNGVFIGDFNTTYRFLYNVDFTNNNRVQQIGTFQPLGRRYPVIVANGNLSYDEGTVSADLLNDNFMQTRVVDGVAIANEQKVVIDYLTDKKPKILRDWHGRVWLCIITGNVQSTYTEGSSLAIPNISFDWKQIGDAESQTDLYYNGILDENQ